MSGRASRWAKIAGLLVPVLLVLLAYYVSPYWNLAPGVTPNRIRAIQPGMAQDEVTAILGPPLSVLRWGPNGAILIYAQPHWFALWSSELWIQLHDGKVNAVRGELVSLLADERGVYSRRSDLPRWESPDFESTFGRWWERRKASTTAHKP